MKKRVGIVLIISILFSGILSAVKYRAPLGEIADLYITEAGDVCYLEVLDSGELFLIRLSQDGTLKLGKTLPNRKNGVEYTYYELAADDVGSLYIHVKAEDGDGIREYVQKYDENGRQDGRIFESGGVTEEEDGKTEDGESVNGGTIRSFAEYGTELSVIRESLKEGEPAVFELCRYDMETQEMREPVLFPFYELDYGYAEEFLYTGEDEIYFINTVGNVYRADRSGSVEQIIFPEGIIPYQISAMDGELYFTDGADFCFYRYRPESTELTRLFEKEDELGAGVRFSDVRMVRKQGTWLTGYHSKEFNKVHSFLFGTDENGGQIYLTQRKLGTAGFLLYFGVLTALAFGLVLGVYSLLRYLWRAGKLMYRLGFIIVFFMSGILMFLVWYLKKSFVQVVENETYYQLYMTVTGALKQIDPYEYASVEIPIERYGEDYYLLSNSVLSLEYLKEYQKERPDGIEKEVYYTFYAVKNGESYVGLDWDINGRDGNHMRSGVLEELTEPAGDYVRWFLTKMSVEDSALEDMSNNSEWIYYAAAIEEDGEVYGYLEAGVNKKLLMLQIRERCRRISLYVGAAVLLGVAAILIVVERLLKKLGKLRDGVLRVAQGDWGATVDISSGDEMQDIGNAFNRMSDQIARYFQSIGELNAVYEKFTPTRLFRLMNLESVLEAEPGRYAREKTAVLWAFAGKKREGWEFEDISRFLGGLSAWIHAGNGIVESFEGDGVRAVYTGLAEEALKAAVKGSLETGAEMILLYEETVFGIVGDEKRMDTLVNTKKDGMILQLKQIAEDLKIPVLLTGDAAEQLGESRGSLRYIGRYGKDGAGNPVDLYEALDALEPDIRQRRTAAKELFEDGIADYLAGDAARARKKFIDCVRKDGTDEAAKRYVFLCDQYLNGEADGFSGEKNSGGKEFGL